MKKFIVKGTFKMGDRRHNFSKKVSVENKNRAADYVRSKLGSDYKCARHLVKIESIEEAKA